MAIGNWKALARSSSHHEVFSGPNHSHYTQEDFLDGVSCNMYFPTRSGSILHRLIQASFRFVHSG